ncbi:MAG: ABC transporter ATP-binding protein [Bauldia sp.]|jgi:iron complex transport system ATP-binding protein|nr:MAG: ABC transporter ATP-binding protein [Bauldia sp.]
MRRKPENERRHAGRRLTLENVAVTLGRASILKDISVDLGCGQIIAVVGANGAGKSTLLSSIAGQLPFDGKILWDEKPVDPRLVGYIPQAVELRTRLSVIEAVLLARFDQLGWRISAADMRAADTALDALGLSPLAARPLDTLSGGQRQLVLLAQRLMREPDLLVLDEPTSALDLRHQMGVLDHLRRYIARTGALILIAIHDVNLAARHADRILMLTGGRLAGFGRSQEVLTPASLRAGFGIETEVLRTTDGYPVIVPTAAAIRSPAAD